MARAQKRPSAVSTRIGSPVRPRQDVAGQGRADRPRGQHPTLGQDEGVAEQRRDLLDVMGHQGDRGQGRIRGEGLDPSDQRLPGAEVETRRRLVEQDELGLGHQGPGDEDPLALARRQGREGPPAEPGQAQPIQGGLGPAASSGR